MDRAAEPGTAFGRVLAGRYLLVELLGHGSTAAVWRARDERLGRDVAVKIVHADADLSEAMRSRFIAEARTAARLEHPAIVEVYDVVADGETTAIVMAYVEGESLATRLQQTGPLSLIEAATIGADIADALAHAHARGVIHCDVKPANIVVGSDGRALLTDFGTADLGVDHARRTVVEGTLPSMPPERLLGEPAAPPADVFALGATLIEAISGRPPWAATSAADLVTLQRAAPPPVAAAGPLAPLLAACLASDPALRPSAVHVSSALRASRTRNDTRPEPPPSRQTQRVVALRSSSPRRAAAVGGLTGVVSATAVAALLGLAPFRGSAVAASPSTAQGAVAAARTSRPSATATARPTPNPTPRPTPRPTPQPTLRPTPVPTATPTPTPTPAPTGSPTNAGATPLTILTPTDGVVVGGNFVTVTGLAAPGATITRDIPMWPDDHTRADGGGRWQMAVRLQYGDNVLRFRVDDDRATELDLHLTAIW